MKRVVCLVAITASIACHSTARAAPDAVTPPGKLNPLGTVSVTP
jgi:hypothetical protein